MKLKQKETKIDWLHTNWMRTESDKISDFFLIDTESKFSKKCDSIFLENK